MKQDIIIQLALLIELFDRSSNKLQLKHSDLHYSHGLKISLYSHESLINAWELSLEENWQKELNGLIEYCTGFNDALFIARGKI